ncbi:hypothetical protein ASPVEDRAFT_78237 [Aspergillus versicolor CBS 583.65]|uniref:Tyrosinase copper-binding domain-containing protein n=1 Tax=Aspergillus versicolor CBS 583.65 TaxID=1036611 RepID=A0A1L9P4N9_ASPVE|nr:uncharacterized protein ASPVEDRAFT_78237 [Aspergillus versicolor CBS 583.65]OJI96468.1 hypothetical protein ASPVEDRAFT_78237 [Aspergillus versicolor CBS 583.65]
MALLKSVLFFLYLVLSLVSALPPKHAMPHGICTERVQRKAWQTLTYSQKKAYIDADLCLMKSPPKLDVRGAQNIWDELQYVHILQSNVVHFTGSFLPWHRLFMHAHDYLQRTECNYTGPQPYWDEILDMGALNESIVFDPNTGFGGNGAGNDLCVADGPFVNLTLHLTQFSNDANYCLSRNFNQTAFQDGNKSNLDACFSKATYSDAWPCWSTSPHGAAHLGVNGVMYDAVGSPGDPIFYLHHTYLDHLWWQWQQQDLPARLFQMSGRNVPTPEQLAMANWTFPSAAILNYDGDPANETTLHHNLWMVGLIPNATVGDVMDLGGNLICVEEA